MTKPRARDLGIPFQGNPGACNALFFASPWWGAILSKLPRPFSRAILRTLDALAHHIPSLSDGVVLKCSLRTGP